jgi:hypothetical protein
LTSLLAILAVSTSVVWLHVWFALRPPILPLWQILFQERGGLGATTMFDSLDDLSAKLSATGYFIHPVMTQVVFLAAKLQKPLLLEGPTGSGRPNWPSPWPQRLERMLSDCNDIGCQ